MRIFLNPLIFLIVFVFLQPAWAQRDSQYQLGVINDPDGFTNAREGPSTKFPVIRKVHQGEVFLVTQWDPLTRKKLKEPDMRAKLKAAGIDPDGLFEWRWVILLDRGDPQHKGGRWAYIHSSRIRTLRSDVSTWAVIDDPDTSDGTEGYIKADRAKYHDTRDWQWAGLIPYVDFRESNR